MKVKTVNTVKKKKVEMHKFLVCTCKSQDFAQSQKKLCGRTTVRSTLLETLYKVASNHFNDYVLVSALLPANIRANKNLPNYLLTDATLPAVETEE